MQLKSLTILLHLILEKYFSTSKCLLLFTNPPTLLTLKTQIPILHFQDILIHHKNGAEIIAQFEALIKTEKERYNQRKYVFINEEKQEIGRIKALKYVHHFLAIEPSAPQIYNLITHLYKAPAYSDENRPVLLDKYFAENGSFLFGNSLFPDKLKDQNGRHLRIGTFTYKPYTIVDDKKAIYDGTEITFLLEFAKKYNLTPAFNIIGGEGDLWGDIYDNGTGGYGVLGVLFDDDVDVASAAFPTWEVYYNYFDYTKPLNRGAVTAIVPAPKLASRLLIPVLPFSLQTWQLIALFFALGVLVVLAILRRDANGTKRAHFHGALMSMTRIFLLQALTLRLNGRIMRLFIALHLVYVLLITTSYSSGLSSIMTVPRYEHGIKNVADMAAKKLKWGARTPAWIVSIKDAQEAEYVEILRNFFVETENELVETSRRDGVGFAMERLSYGHYAIEAYIRSDIISNYRILQEDIYYELCILMLRKNSVLLPLIDRMVLRVFEAGLQSYWENRIVYEYMDYTVQKVVNYYTHHVTEHSVVKLSWVHVEGAFTLMLIGHLSALTTFIYEIVNYRKQITQKLGTIH